jgi:hypothetical protein
MEALAGEGAKELVVALGALAVSLSLRRLPPEG